jgi:hypothetical protein
MTGNLHTCAHDFEEVDLSTINHAGGLAFRYLAIYHIGMHTVSSEEADSRS